MTLASPREMLPALANLRDDGLSVFLKQFRGDYAAEDFLALYGYRNDLRKIWEGDRQAMAVMVSAWVKLANKRRPYCAMTISGTRGQYVRVVPNDGILPLALALGVSELWPKMAVCGNPECPNPYFLKGRKKQRFCERPACSAYGQREHKRNWWHEHAEEWKKKRRGRKSKPTRKKKH